MAINATDSTHLIDAEELTHLSCGSALQILFGLASVQFLSVWKPADVVTYFCSHWYHQAPSPREMEASSQNSCGEERFSPRIGGIQIFQHPNVTVKSTNNTLGYSEPPVWHRQ
ncbi:hypothetical protein GQ44DRAFT_730788 [Phaeosphaeriaceae sp. PMI808]|nr:hypothetical protein GQ44DRAFT_730788 [Phaeosphaeriaceae sp. PMI808]